MFDCSIIPAAGAGSRFHDLGKVYPKCCLPYKNKPIIKHIVEECLKVSKTVYIVVTNDAQKNSIKEALLYDVRVKYVTVLEDEMRVRGPATSLYSGVLAAKYDGKGNAFVALSDAVFSSAPVEPFVGLNRIFVQPVEDYERWCMVSADPFKLYDKPKEKPPTDLAAIGLYTINLLEYDEAYNSAMTAGVVGEFQLSYVFSKMPSFQPVLYNRQIIDLGTYEEYDKALSVSISRSFNQITVLNVGNGVRRVGKSSTNHSKLMQEACFISSLPKSLKLYYPEIFSIDSTKSMYIMDHARGVSLRHLALYLDNSRATWKRIFQRIRDFMEENSSVSYKEEGFWSKMHEKNISRLQSLKDSGFVSYDEYEKDLAFLHSLNFKLKNSEWANRYSLFHGDLHFSNCVFDFAADRLTVFDPRGEFVGSELYDLAKLCHSVFGMYDFIDSEVYIESEGKFAYFDKGWAEIRKTFLETFKDLVVDEELLVMLTASLFLTMIPLHDHNKRNQRAFYAEYKRLSDIRSFEQKQDENV